MTLVTLHTSIGTVIRIETDESLDLTSHDMFVRASHFAEEVNMKTIDLWKTYIVLDSGLAMLLMLRKLTDPLRNPIRLVNCNPDIRARLIATRVGAQLQIN